MEANNSLVSQDKNDRTDDGINKDETMSLDEVENKNDVQKNNSVDTDLQLSKDDHKNDGSSNDACSVGSTDSGTELNKNTELAKDDHKNEKQEEKENAARNNESESEVAEAKCKNGATLDKNDSGISVEKTSDDTSSDDVENKQKEKQSMDMEVDETATADETRPREDEAKPRDDGRPAGTEHSDSSQNSEHSDQDDDNEQAKSSSDDEVEYDPDAGAAAKNKWFAYKQVQQRQYGFLNRYAPILWGDKYSGSLHAVVRWELMYKMDGHRGCVNAVHFNQKGNLLASGSDDLNIVIWDWAKNIPLVTYDSGHRNNVFQAKFLPISGDTHIVSCARDGAVRIGELSSTGTCRSTRKLASHKGAAHKLCLEPDSPHVFLSAGEDGLIYEIDVREDKPNKLLICKENNKKIALYTIHTNPLDSYEFAVGGRDQYARIYDKRKITQDDEIAPVRKYCPHHLQNGDIRSNVTCLVYNYNGTELLVSYNDEDIYTFDTSHSDGAEYTYKFTGHRNSATVKGVNYYGPRSEFIISGSDCGHIYTWDHDSQKIVNFLRGDEGGVVNCLETHPSFPVMATSGLDSDVKIWVPSREEPNSMPELKKTVTNNMKRRKRDHRLEGSSDFIDGQMLWFLMRQLRRRARRRAGEEAELEEIESESTSSDDAEDSNDEGDPSSAVQCNPS